MVANTEHGKVKRQPLRSLQRGLNPFKPTPCLLSSRRAGRSSGPFLSSMFYLQNRMFLKWAMLDLNQRPPPCKGGKGRCRVSPDVAELA
jgi:hypothetical protein